MHSVSSILNGMDYAPPGIAWRGFFYAVTDWREAFDHNQ